MPQSRTANHEHREFVAEPEEAGERLDLFLARHLAEWSRSHIQRVIREGRVQVGASAARKPGERIRSADVVRVTAEPEPAGAEPENLPLAIVYEDHDLAVLDKPAGMTVHGGAGTRSGTLVNALLYHFQYLSQLGGQERRGIVHRLDKMTSGLIVVAKNDFAHRALSEQFQSRDVRKTYQALVHGTLDRAAGRITRPVGRDPVRRVRMKTGGIAPREALTEFAVLRRFSGFTLLEAHPRTGRTHQLRVHFASLGHPIAGDTLYGAPGKFRTSMGEDQRLSRHFLHAAEIEFKHPRSGEVLHFNSPLPKELERLLAQLKPED